MATLPNLTAREQGILELLLLGRSNKDIAAAACISKKTVEFHLANIYAKLGVKTRLMAAIWAMEGGRSSGTRDFPS